MMGEEMKQGTMTLQAELNLEAIQAQNMWAYEIEKMKKGFDLQGEQIQVEGRTVGHAIQADSKVIAAHIAAEASKVKVKQKPKSSK